MTLSVYGSIEGPSKASYTNYGPSSSLSLESVSSITLVGFVGVGYLLVTQIPFESRLPASKISVDTYDEVGFPSIQARMSS